LPTWLHTCIAMTVSQSSRAMIMTVAGE